MSDTLRFERSNSGAPTVVETGGGMSNTGSCTIWCGSRGERLRPIYVPRRVACNSTAAVFILRPGMMMVRASWSGRYGTEVGVYEVKGLDAENGSFSVEKLSGDLTPFSNAMAAAKAKASAYHARYTAYADIEAYAAARVQRTGAAVGGRS